MLSLSPERLAHERARAEEIQRAVAVALWMVGMGMHSDRLSTGSIWIGSGALLGEVGPLVALLIAVRREEP